MAIKDWPESERPRERLLTSGAHALSDAELLAVFLRTGTRGRSAINGKRRFRAAMIAAASSKDNVVWVT